MDKKTVGRLGEDFAARVLAANGYRILERNFRCKAGEIDLIASKGGRLCFVEVKTRQTARFGTPAEAVDREKQRRIRRAAEFYLHSRVAGVPETEFQVMEIYLHHIGCAF